MAELSEHTLSNSFSSVANLVVFTVDERRLALALNLVDRVVRMVEATSLPAAPAVVAGVIDVAGEVMPVFDVRRRFESTGRNFRASDCLIVARTPRRRVALAADRVDGIITVEATAIRSGEEILPDLPHVAGIARLPGSELILIQNLERFLSASEEAALDAALANDER